MAEHVLPDGSHPTNSDGAQRCRLVILQDARPTPEGRWRGVITNPEDGSKWSCEIWVEAGALRLRGYVLTPLLGQTQTWPRFTGKVAPNCSIS